MKKLWGIFTKKEERMVITLFFILLAASLLELFGLVLVIPYVNLMVDDSRVSEYLIRFPILHYMIDFSGNYQLSLSLWFASFYLVKNSLLGGLSFIEQTLLKNIKSNVTGRMFFHYMRQPYAFHLKSRSSELVRSITYDATVVVESVLKQGAMLIAEILLFIGVLAVLIWKNPLALSVFLVMIVPVVIVYLLLKKRLLLWGKIMQEREANVIRHLQEGVGGIKDAIVLGVEGYFENNFNKNILHQAYIKRNRDVAVLVPRYLIETLMMVAMAGALFWMAQSGGLMRNISSIAFLAIVSVRILPMSNRILSAVSNIRSSTSSIDVVYKTARLEAQTSQEHVEKNTEFMGATGPFKELIVERLSFGYPDASAVLEEINFCISRGETVGIVGGSGAGKTTLVDLLLGLLTPSEGRLTCNGLPVHDNLRQWQQRIGYVQQVIFLMDATIKENIAYGVPAKQIDINRIHSVIQMAKLEKWISGLPQGIDSVVGERGVRISGGQRQRIGLARALYQNPEILVLDEATSALDNHTEKEIMRDIYAMHGDRTIIMIAHRISTIKKCDRIIVLDKGNIAGVGRFDDLSSNNQAFQKIVSMEENRSKRV